MAGPKSKTVRDPDSLGSRVTCLRQEKGWSQTELGRLVGVHFSTIGKIENGVSPLVKGKQNLIPPTLRELARVLKDNLGREELTPFAREENNIYLLPAEPLPPRSRPVTPPKPPARKRPPTVARIIGTIQETVATTLPAALAAALQEQLPGLLAAALQAAQKYQSEENREQLASLIRVELIKAGVILPPWPGLTTDDFRAGMPPETTEEQKVTLMAHIDKHIAQLQEEREKAKREKEKGNETDLDDKTHRSQ